MSLSPFSAPTPPATHTLSLHDALPICKRYSRFNPALTVNYNWTDDLSTYAKVVTGYKAGGASESSAIGQFHHTFSPEDVISYELGLKSHWLDRKLRLNAARSEERRVGKECRDRRSQDL